MNISTPSKAPGSPSARRQQEKTAASNVPHINPKDITLPPKDRIVSAIARTARAIPQFGSKSNASRMYRTPGSILGRAVEIQRLDSRTASALLEFLCFPAPEPISRTAYDDTVEIVKRTVDNSREEERARASTPDAPPQASLEHPLAFQLGRYC